MLPHLISFILKCYDYLDQSQSVTSTIIIADVWKILEDAEVNTQRPLKQLGPARRVAEKPFLIVVGNDSFNEN